LRIDQFIGKGVWFPLQKRSWTYWLAKHNYLFYVIPFWHARWVIGLDWWICRNTEISRGANFGDMQHWVIKSTILCEKYAGFVTSVLCIANNQYWKHIIYGTTPGALWRLDRWAPSGDDGMCSRRQEWRVHTSTGNTCYIWHA